MEFSYQYPKYIIFNAKHENKPIYQYVWFQAPYGIHIIW